MKNFTLFLFLLLLSLSSGFAAKYTVISVGTTFSPDLLTIHTGDTVVFSLASSHNAVEVSLNTYNANGQTSNGGFSVPFGGGTVIFKNAGTFYYVCQPHASIGMKGRIIVQAGTTGIISVEDEADLIVYPNPSENWVKITYVLNSKANVNIKLFDLRGRKISEVSPGIKDAGTQTETVPTGTLSRGIYLLSLDLGDKTVVKKVIIQ